MEETKTKVLWKSKTFWVNAVALGASVAAGFGLDIGVETQGALVGGVMAVVNIILRALTNRGVTIT
tara:strand:- start:637 stop:834 length:198 start_codon:yes stop_codon:yes gene_type:complete